MSKSTNNFQPVQPIRISLALLKKVKTLFSHYRDSRRRKPTLSMPPGTARDQRWSVENGSVYNNHVSQSRERHRLIFVALLLLTTNH